MRPARIAAATASTALLTVSTLLAGPTAASAATQPGPTQVVNDAGSSGTAVIRDNRGKRFHLKRRGYVLHDSESQFFTWFYVPRGSRIVVYATDPRGVPFGPKLQEEKASGWYETNAKVDDADLVLIKVYSTVSAVSFGSR